jgi:hypothetical protein
MERIRYQDEMRLTDYAEKINFRLPEIANLSLSKQWWFRPRDLWHLGEYEIQTQSKGGIIFEYC